jgi:hypothetical protein
MKKLILILTLLFSVSQAGSDKKIINFVGENLEYRVSFLGLTLGSIKLGIVADTTINGNDRIIAYSEVKTADEIPFVNFEADFKSFMNDRITTSHRFVSNKKEKNGYLHQETIYDYDNNKMTFKEWRKKELFNEMEMDIENKFNDGTSLFFFARKYSGIGRTIKVPTMIDTLPGITIINFTQKSEEIEIDAVDYPIKTTYLDGEALWDGIYGLSGKFKGWFSDDEASIPVRAEMNVYVGSVVIELVKWERGDWQPPKN